MERETILEVNHLSKTFGTNPVLKDIDFRVCSGDVISVIGPSGSGKSTLLRCINLLEEPDSGHVWFHDTDLAGERTNVNQLRESIGMVFQSFNLFNNKNALESCSKCPMWQKCQTSEYTVATSSSVSRKLVDELSHTIDMHIIERIKNKSI